MRCWHPSSIWTAVFLKKSLPQLALIGSLAGSLCRQFIEFFLSFSSPPSHLPFLRFCFPSPPVFSFFLSFSVLPVGGLEEKRAAAVQGKNALTPQTVLFAKACKGT